MTGLFYTSDDKPGFTRVKGAKHFRYRDTKGNWIKDADEIARINKLAIPPAYADVWICPSRNGHLQATGKDARGRKQYRYHPDWQLQRNDNKFGRLQSFGQALPRIRARIARDLTPKRNQPISRTVVLATLVRLLDTTFVRVGNDEYARDNGSYGLTTLRNPHAGVRGATLRLKFRGKSGVMQDLQLNDPKVATVVRRCQQLPGQLLFQYEDYDGEVHGVGSGDVNDYIAEIVEGISARHEAVSSQAGAAELASPGRRRSAPSGGRELREASERGGQHFTAKDFRTWHGTVQALELTRLACNGPEPDNYSAKTIVAEVARQLGNTPAVCKKSYIHPAVMALATDLAADASAMSGIWDALEKGSKPARRMRAAEARLLVFLKAQQRLARKRTKSQKA
ncbi:MAG: DNA topoisomerase IB [Pseudomonadota bacterium]